MASFIFYTTIIIGKTKKFWRKIDECAIEVVSFGHSHFVIPACFQRGSIKPWIPAFAGMTQRTQFQ
ncbi:MAG: hypothetical protein A3J12_09455 [Omnitrophica bacterium RIFCSPLOWO2_02_FULL_44_11]|nr:MAG: hypothetical protein A3B72_00800 [Omnitrophica bacterium RIFCSPHIGHO2_02_FULL_45_28]OGX03804.1 MAG: hypothetical protein A3J12_09455 [Omnitrophica bacterium RIFCSPLOWO2_02_FULL_44_11]